MNLKRTRISLDPGAKKDVGVLHAGQRVVLGQNLRDGGEGPQNRPFSTVVAVGSS